MTSQPLPRSAWLLLLLVWAIATMFLSGHLGWWNDDFLFNQRDPDTGQIESLYYGRQAPFSNDSVGTARPLRNLITPLLITLTWDHPWIAHSIAALIHLAAILLMFRLLRAFRFRPGPAFAGALVMASFPAGFEAIFWIGTISTLIGSALLLAVMVLLARAAARGSTRLKWAAVAAALPIPLLNEQPAACLAVTPLVVWAALPPGSRGLRALRAFAWPIALMALWCAAYFIALYAGSRHGVGPTGMPLVSIVEASRQVFTCLADIAKGMFFWNGLGFPAIREGVAGLADRPARAAVFMLALAACIVSLKPWRTPDDRPAGASAPPATGVCLLLAAGWMVAAVLPMAAVGLGTTRPRMFYVIHGAVCIVAAVLAAAARDRAFLGRRAPLLVWQAVVGIVVLLGILSMVGVQRGYQLMWRQDQSIAEHLRRLAPHPAPDTVLVILDDRSRTMRSSRWRFDAYFLNSTKWNWASPYFGRWTYQRRDIETITYWPELKHSADHRLELPPASPIHAADSDVLVTYQPVRALARPDANPQWLLALGRTGTAFAWSRILPIVIDEDGRVHIVTRLELVAGSAERAFEPPQAQVLLRAGAITARTWRAAVDAVQ